jgi:hypothetical protein
MLWTEQILNNCIFVMSDGARWKEET